MLALMRQYFFDHINEAMQMLREERREATKVKLRKRAKQRASG
jgi:hypothetical protein